MSTCASRKTTCTALFCALVVGLGLFLDPPAGNHSVLLAAQANPADLNDQLEAVLRQQKFTGQIGVEATLEKRLGRPLNKDRADLGRMLFFDSFIALHQDNSCAGCHSPTAGFADTQSIAIGVDSNGKVGPNRVGARNQRRTPSVINNAFYPSLMLNGRFSALSGDPFDNSKGFDFPLPEGTTRFPPRDPEVTHLLVAQAHIPPTELPEMAGFRNIAGSLFSTSRFQTKLAVPQNRPALVPAPGEGEFGVLGQGMAISQKAQKTEIKVFRQMAKPGPPVDEEPDFTQFDDGDGLALPPPDTTNSRNEPIRTVVISLLNGNAAYRALFAKSYPEVARGGPITYPMLGQAIAEFEFSLTFADAPIDQFARGNRNAMTEPQKRGALLFFGKAQCVQCHAVGGQSNEMFSDFAMHNIGVPQVAPHFGKGKGNVPFRNSAGKLVVKGNEDWGRFDISEDENDRYKFRTSPLRNISTHPTFFHNGAFTKLDDAIRHHLDVAASAKSYDPAKAGIDDDLRTNIGPIDPVLQRVDALVSKPLMLNDQEFNDLLAFVRDALLDPRVTKDNLRKLIPEKLPSGQPLPVFE